MARVGVAVQASVGSALPLWYHLAFLALLAPATLAGALLRPRGAASAAPSLEATPG